MQPEANHATIEQALHAALWEPATPIGLTAPDPGEIARRFAVYRNNVQHGLSRALGTRFPAIERLVGVEFFAAMARVFAAAHPPRDPVLLGWGADLPAFIAGFPPLAHLPYLADVARLELARGRAYHAADATAIERHALTGADPASLRLCLHPSVQLFASTHSAVSIWAANRPGTEPAAVRAAGPEQALIARAPGFAVIMEQTDPTTHAVLSALATGQSLAQAAGQTDPATALALLLRHSLIIDLKTGETS